MQEFVLKTDQESHVYLMAGAIDRAGELLQKSGISPCLAAVTVDASVPDTTADTLERSLRACGFRTARIVIPSGEASKSWTSLGTLLETLSSLGVTRSDCIVALGGGVIGDLTGFAASVYLRGIACVQVPTTPLAMIDSAVGGKTAVDLPGGKNLAGSFLQPTAVICDPSVLSSVSPRVMREAFGEVIKYGVLMGGRLWELLQSGTGLTEEVIGLCLRCKLRLVEQDERDLGCRRLLNLGHTFGHAVEHCCGYSLFHGECVSIGMARLSAALAGEGLCSCSTEINAVLEKYGLPVYLPVSAEDLYPVVLRDKKADNATIQMVVPQEIGNCSLRAFSRDEAARLLRSAFPTETRTPIQVAADPSKSLLHRLCICGALGTEPIRIRNVADLCADVLATLNCIREMGGSYEYSGNCLTVFPIQAVPEGELTLHCGESGSTLRFLLPICGALGLKGCFLPEGSLKARPIAPLAEALCRHGMKVTADREMIRFSGRLQAGDYVIPGNISSQYLSGLLFALPLLAGDSTITITSPLQSEDYVVLTRSVLSLAGITADPVDSRQFSVPGNRRYSLPEEVSSEGDWSSAAYFLCAGAVSRPVTVTGTDPASRQPDRRIVDFLRCFGAGVICGENSVTVYPAKLHAASFDCSGTPDLVPPLAVAALAAEGTSVFTGLERLRYKESSRGETLVSLIRALGGEAEFDGSSLRITGRRSLTGGTVPVFHDHRIAMTAICCGLLTREPVVPDDTECIRKSSPSFPAKFASILIPEEKQT